MDRDQRSRSQKSISNNGGPRAPKNRTVGSRMGLQKKGQTGQMPPQRPPQRSAQRPAASPQQQPRRTAAPPQQPGRRPPQGRGAAPQNRAAAPRRSQQTAQLNPQKPGYNQGAARPTRRVTQAEQVRRRNRRRLLGVLVVLAVIVLGGVLSINLLFKVTGFRVENFDRTTPADTGIYTEDQIISLLDVQQGDSLFFSAAAKTKFLQEQLPYLDEVRVDLQLPGTVVVKVKPATERFALQYAGGWLVLSDTLKILRSESAQPDGLVLLQGTLPTGFVPTVGQVISLENYNSLLGEQPATAETAQTTADQALSTLLADMETSGLLDGVTALNVADLSALGFTYQGRVQVELGNAMSLDYKLRMAAEIILDADKGLSASDRGTLDLSQQTTDGEIRGYFRPEEAAPTPEPTPAAEDADTDTPQDAPAE